MYGKGKTNNYFLDSGSKLWTRRNKKNMTKTRQLIGFEFVTWKYIYVDISAAYTPVH